MFDQARIGNIFVNLLKDIPFQMYSKICTLFTAKEIILTIMIFQLLNNQLHIYDLKNYYLDGIFHSKHSTNIMTTLLSARREVDCIKYKLYQVVSTRVIF